MAPSRLRDEATDAPVLPAAAFDRPGSSSSSATMRCAVPGQVKNQARNVGLTVLKVEVGNPSKPKVTKELEQPLPHGPLECD